MNIFDCRFEDLWAWMHRLRYWDHCIFRIFHFQLFYSKGIRRLTQLDMKMACYWTKDTIFTNEWICTEFSNTFKQTIQILVTKEDSDLPTVGRYFNSQRLYQNCCRYVVAVNILMLHSELEMIKICSMTSNNSFSAQFCAGSAWAFLVNF